MLQMYSNPLFLSEHAQPATQLNKLSDAAPVADSTAEAPAATAESATTPQTNQIADCVPVAESASRPDSEQAADHGSVAEAASQLHSDLALTADAASQLHTEQDAEETSATDAASQLQSEQDAEHASASQSLQDQQDTDRAAAASSASTSGRIEEAEFELPASFTPCSKVHMAACATSQHGKPLLLCNNVCGDTAQLPV